MVVKPQGDTERKPGESREQRKEKERLKMKEKTQAFINAQLAAAGSRGGAGGGAPRDPR